MKRKKPKLATTKQGFVKYLIVSFGGLAALFIVLLGAGLAYAIHVSLVLRPSAKIYADESVQAIIRTGSKEELITRISPEFRAATNKGRFDEFFTALDKLGSFQSYGGSQGNENINVSLNEGFYITATFQSTATFQNGRVDILIGIIRHGDIWQIQSIRINESL